jgi:hypothetical protein
MNLKSPIFKKRKSIETHPQKRKKKNKRKEKAKTLKSKEI